MERDSPVFLHHHETSLFRLPVPFAGDVPGHHRIQNSDRMAAIGRVPSVCGLQKEDQKRILRRAVSEEREDAVDFISLLVLAVVQAVCVLGYPHPRTVEVRPDLLCCVVLCHERWRSSAYCSHSGRRIRLYAAVVFLSCARIRYFAVFWMWMTNGVGRHHPPCHPRGGNARQKRHHCAFVSSRGRGLARALSSR